MWLKVVNFVYLLKEPATFCDSMDGTGEYDAECNKLVGERQMPYDLTLRGI